MLSLCLNITLIFLCGETLYCAAVNAFCAAVLVECLRYYLNIPVWWDLVLCGGERLLCGGAGGVSKYITLIFLCGETLYCAAVSAFCAAVLVGRSRSCRLPVSVRDWNSGFSPNGLDKTALLLTWFKMKSTMLYSNRVPVCFLRCWSR
jgi:hypothetical protein